MSEDKKLRCAVVYRLEGNGPTVLPLCKFDHAGKDPSQSAEGKKKADFAKAVARVIAADPPKGVQPQQKVGGFKVIQSDEHQVVYGADIDGICYCVITGLQYQNRIAIKFLEELATDFKPAHGTEALKCKENGLQTKAKKLLKEKCDKFETPEKSDSASRVIHQVEGVKAQMADNIAGMLKNQESAESLNQKSSELAEQANVFKKNSKQLKNTMRWKNLKMTLMLGCVVLVIGTIVLLPMLTSVGSLFGGGGDDGGSGDE